MPLADWPLDPLSLRGRGGWPELFIPRIVPFSYPTIAHIDGLMIGKKLGSVARIGQPGTCHDRCDSERPDPWSRKYLWLVGGVCQPQDHGGVDN